MQVQQPKEIVIHSWESIRWCLRTAGRGNSYGSLSPSLHMEDVTVTQKGNLLLFVRLFVLLFNEIPENDYLRLLALLGLAAFLLTLYKRQIFAAAPKRHLIRKGIGFDCCSADSASVCDPRLLPRDDSRFHLVDFKGIQCCMAAWATTARLDKPETRTGNLSQYSINLTRCKFIIICADNRFFYKNVKRNIAKMGDKN